MKMVAVRSEIGTNKFVILWNVFMTYLISTLCASHMSMYSF